MSSLAQVWLWGTRIGAVLLEDDQRTAAFEYEPDFASRGVEVAPSMMPLGSARHRFPELSDESFSGLPGMLADSLPDRFGHALIDAWLASRGRSPGSMNGVERLCYIGRRGMGALEFQPAAGPDPTESHIIDVGELAELAAEVLSNREDLVATFKGSEKQQALQEILRVGTSAGGARAKALIALNPSTMEMRSGQLDADPGFEHCILKFDGVKDPTRDLGEAAGYGAVEFVYSKLAAKAGITMRECRMLELNGRRHFMTRRFDRPGPNAKLHMQSLGALGHLDYNQVGAHSYEQAFQAIRRLGLPMADVEQQFRRMIFNVVARNQDDHVKNIAFLMDREGQWSLSPAFDVTYAFSPKPGKNTASHQMSINHKREDFSMADFREVARHASIRRDRVDEMIEEVIAAVRQWPALAARTGVENERIAQVEAVHRLGFPDV